MDENRGRLTEFTSILDLRENPEREQPRAAFYQDLNLDRIIERICREWEEDVSRFYYYLPADKGCEEYRREVFADVGRPGIFECLNAFAERMRRWRHASKQKARVRLERQKEIWHISEVKYYCEAFATLGGELSGLAPKSRGMREFVRYLGRYLEGEEFAAMYEAVRGTREELDKIRLVLDYRDGRLYVAQGKVGGAYEEFLKESFEGSLRPLSGLFGVSAELSELETEVVKIVEKRRPELFRRAEDFCRRFREYADDTLLRFSEEIHYYLSFCHFERRLRERGLVFAAPKASSDGNLSAAGLYDLALACAGLEEGRSVVPNFAEYREGERFLVLTGPNQGGKTTFARSLGQLVYFAKMGLDVPAREARVPYFRGLMTHFSVEESVETGRGKLKEELVRLKPMMSASGENAFVVINELFTTAANYDACIMGKRVLEHFVSRGCRGIYVTHLRELAEGGEGIVSLRAMLDENGRQSFRIERSRAEDSAGAERLADKYGLTYAQLRGRLS